MVATETFDRNDLAGLEFGNGLDEWKSGRVRCIGIPTFPPSVLPFQSRPTFLTRVGLGVEPPVGRIVILLPTLRTHGKISHRSVGPVVRQIANDGKPRTTMGTIDERITRPTVLRIRQFAQTIRARRQVRGNMHRHRSNGVRVNDLKAGGPLHRQHPLIDSSDDGLTGRGLPKLLEKSGNDLFLAFNFKTDTVRIVADKAGQTVCNRGAIDSRSKTNPLDTTGNLR